MNPRLKRWIIIANIAAYVVVGLVIYARRKGGFKAFLPRETKSLEEVIAKQKGVPAPATPVAKAPLAAKKVTPTAVTPPLARKPLPEISMSELPPHIREARTLLENMKVKEQTLKFDYYAFNRDPFVSLVGIESYLSQIKLTPDDYADLPPGLPVKAKQKASPFTLSGTIKSKDGESSAIINGQVLQEGDLIEGYKVTKIEKKSVTLTSNNKVIRLQIPKDESQSDTTILQRLKELKQ